MCSYTCKEVYEIGVDENATKLICFLVICADFCTISAQFLYTEEFCADFCKYKDFCAGNLFPPKAKLFSLESMNCHLSLTVNSHRSPCLVINSDQV